MPRLSQLKIVTRSIDPPRPDRTRFEAVIDNHQPGDPVGQGATEAEAVGDLVTNYLQSE